MRTLGIILIILGIIGFALGGVSFTRTQEAAEVGPLELQVEEEETIPLAPWASGAAVVAGIALVAIDVSKRRSE